MQEMLQSKGKKRKAEFMEIDENTAKSFLDELGKGSEYYENAF